MRIPMITAHSGCEGTARDSLDSVECAIRLGADVVEMDIRKAPDGAIRISHNCCSQEEYVLKPRLEEVFDYIKDTSLALNCDLKESNVVYEVLQLAKSFAFDSERIIFSGCLSPEQLARDASLVQQAGMYLNIEEILKFMAVATLFEKHQENQFCNLMNTPWEFVRGCDLTEDLMESIIVMLQTLKVRGLNMPYTLLGADFAEKLRKSNIPFSVWTVNTPDLMERAIQMGAANITTQNVKGAMSCRKKLRGF